MPQIQSQSRRDGNRANDLHQLVAAHFRDIVRCQLRNRRFVDVGFDFLVIDDTDPSPTIDVLVFADEDDEEPTGDGTHSPDAKDDGDILRLRSERKGDSDGRVYLIVIVATDAAGNEGFDCCTVVVPKSMSKKHIAEVDEQAAIAVAFCLEFGEPPPGFVEVGDGPLIGPKQ